MTLYLFERLERVSTSWHPEGGLVVVAKDLENAKRLVDEYNADSKKLSYRTKTDNEIEVDDWDKAKTYTVPDESKPEVIVFPDAGCC